MLSAPTVVLWKSAQGRAPYKSTKGGVGIFLCVSAFNLERASCHVYSNSMPLQQIIGQTIAYNWVTQQLRSQVLTAHNTVNDTMLPWGGGAVCICPSMYCPEYMYLGISGYSDEGGGCSMHVPIHVLSRVGLRRICLHYFEHNSTL